MSESNNIEIVAHSLRSAVSSASHDLIDRAALVDTIILAAVAQEHVLVIGPPGTAKSEAARRIAGAVGGQYFEYLLGRFTEPSEIFGPVDLRKLREGIVETQTAGMLPEAEIAFLDEIFLGSTAILNTLLGILNERVFLRGHTRMNCPLRICIGASNSIPEDETLAAFADRFLVRVFIEPIADPMIEELLSGGWGLATSETGERNVASVGDLDVLARTARSVDMNQVRPIIARAIRLLRRAGVLISDRRAVKIQKLVAAAAVLDGRTTATEADLWAIVTAVPTYNEQAVARETLRDLLAPSENQVLAAAAEEASLGPLARASRISEHGRALLENIPCTDDRDQRETWELKVEGIAREIDATFDAQTMPSEIRSIRERIIEVLHPSVEG